ncbi:MAG: DNA polymerase I [Lachnospiraceae bacterium]|nr:DNA polymerase I [Lachnospiraceae bacterium]
MKEKIMLIDGNSIVNRAFYGVPLLTNSKGVYTNAVYGFLNILFKLIEEEKPSYIAVAFDLAAPTFRHKMYSDYKGTRKGMPNELGQQMPVLKEVLSLMDIYECSLEGYEADDILGTLSEEAYNSGILPVIVSGDRDLLQLATDEIKVRIPKTKGGRTETEDYYAKDVIEKYNVTPIEFIDLKALMGDASDNIPGVKGIGEKTASKIIGEYKTIEAAIENADKIMPKSAGAKIAEFKDDAILSKKLATIKKDVPLEFDFSDMGNMSMANPKAYEILKELEFNSLLKLFDNPIIERGSSNKYKTVKNLSDVPDILKACKNKETAYTLFEENGEIFGLAFYNAEIGGVFVSAGDFLVSDIVSAFKSFFEDGDYIKITHDTKRDIAILRLYGIEMSKVSFDIEIAAYVINPTAERYSFDIIAKEYLNEMVSSEEEVLGKGKGKASYASLEEEKLAGYCVGQAEIIYRAKSVMSERISSLGQDKLFYDIEMPLVYVLADMEKYGIKIDKEALIEYQGMLSVKIDDITKEIYELSGEEFNINSPKQLGVILFEKLGIKGSKKTKTGFSTAAEVLEKLKYDYPIVDKILTYRQFAKLKSTYADGLLSVMDPKTNRVYSTFNQTITATGRISSTEPNLQNIPIRLELGRELRRVFVPENEDYVFADADYSQIELRVLAHISGDENLIKAFFENQDIHRLTASQVLNIPFEDVTPAQRNAAKAINFGIVYGIGPFSLSQDLGITMREAERYIKSYFAKYPKIKEYMDKTIKDAQETGFVLTMMGRRRIVPEINSNNFNIRGFGERIAMNTPIQGSAADIIKIAMVRVSESLKKSDLKSRLILQVHDELLIEALKSEIEEVKKILKHEMENAVSMKVPLIADVHTGASWFELK